jgi:hypothetical protein
MILDEFSHLPIHRNRKWALRNVAKGKCPQCSRPVKRGCYRCQYHLDKAAANQVKRNARLQAEGRTPVTPAQAVKMAEMIGKLGHLLDTPAPQQQPSDGSELI